LIPYLVQPTDVMPGVANWFASTCHECPAGCGIRIKQREGRAIKLEGNPLDPVSRGGLCARGQAGLQGLYDPDRVKSPMLKTGGQWKAITWDEGIALAGQKIGAGKGKVALVTGHATGSYQKLATDWAAAAGGIALAYEPFAHESLREANRRTFGIAAIPHYDFARSRYLVAFGADFLETWLSPVGHARGFAEMRGRTDSGGFVAVEPRLSLTGANADEWVAIKSGGEMALALGMAHVILAENLGPAMADRGGLADATAAWTPEAVAQQTEVSAETVTRLARSFASTRPSLAVAGGVAAQSEQAVALAAAVNVLNAVAGNVGETVRFDRTLNLDGLAPFSDVQRLIAAMDGGRVDVLLVHEANPAYSVPQWAGFSAAMDKVGFKISLSTTMDETAERCDLILPAAHALESWGDAQPARGVLALQQPGSRKLPMFDSREAGETLIAVGKAAGFGAQWPAAWLDYVKAQWKPVHQRLGGGRTFDAFWTDTLKNGGVFEDVTPVPVRWAGAPAFAAPAARGAGDFALVLYPSPAPVVERGNCPIRPPRSSGARGSRFIPRPRQSSGSSPEMRCAWRPKRGASKRPHTSTLAFARTRSRSRSARVIRATAVTRRTAGSTRSLCWRRLRTPPRERSRSPATVPG
jgi:molybdopterin-containing oxidoreductase family iron-sulfur binding subunit